MYRDKSQRAGLGHARREFADGSQYLEATADLSTRTHGAFGQQHQFAELQSGGSLGDSFQKAKYALFDALTFIVPRVR